MKKIVGEFRKNTGPTRSEGGSCDSKTTEGDDAMHRRSQDFVWGCTFFAKKVDLVVAV